MACLRAYLVHHGDAVGPEVDLRRPLSAVGRADTERLAADLADRGVRPAVVWHSGKLRAKQTAEIVWRACNALAEFTVARNLQPSDAPEWLRDTLRHEPRDLLIVGHYPHLPKLLALMRGDAEGAVADFPRHGVVALRTDDEGETWTEEWRTSPTAR